MAKVKMSKKATSIDMTAMCDVAFLLLTFFILTATAKQPEPLPVDTPNSTVEDKLPEKNLAIITIGDNGKVFMGIKEIPIRRETLKKMAELKGVKFSDDEITKFGLMDEFGVPFNQLKTLIGMTSTQRNVKGQQIGIPHDTIPNKNELSDWILQARNANAETNLEQLNFAIKGDAKEQYPQIKAVMDILQDQKVNKFYLVTGLRSDNF
ncbi:MAG: biopolymer transporter ExbD [Flavobacterium sp. BFFFF1]|uniref:ExbD/TolR family protein n=1 Tax=Flavobacterium sp. BFFFF1 TaxID=2015557 RepID=UPI000BDCF1D6|nr:biopolymer transporter ExbD [Flavobacterium sp. BFFFF1]OYU79784.1 MAG: biopolymer transporter ExbD [Flavobacterium sp. BFFFF1]